MHPSVRIVNRETDCILDVDIQTAFMPRDGFLLLGGE